jgi:hypothetical protein
VNPVLYSYAVHGACHPRAEIEAAVEQSKYDLTASERSELNGALLARLDAAKKAQGPVGQRKELLQDPAISLLVNTLLVVNEPWVENRVRAFSRGRDFDEMKSLALTGGGGETADVRGVMGAILEYDYQLSGVAAFSRYLAQAIRNALFAPREETRSTSLPRADKGWRDRRQRRPENVAIDAELLAVLRQAIEELPPRNRDVARFMVEYIERTGERPTAREVGESRTPPVTKQMGEILMKQTIDRLKEQVEATHPQLARDGVGGWDEFKKVFTIHKHAGPGTES